MKYEFKTGDDGVEMVTITIDGGNAVTRPATQEDHEAAERENKAEQQMVDEQKKNEDARRKREEENEAKVAHPTAEQTKAAGVKAREAGQKDEQAQIEKEFDQGLQKELEDPAQHKAYKPAKPK